MLPYLLVLGITCFAMFFGSGLGRKEQKQLAFVFILFITFFAAARGYVGTDTYSYHHIFLDHKNESFLWSISSIEPLFSVLMRVSSFFSESSFFLFQ